MVCSFFDKRTSGGAPKLAQSETLAMWNKSTVKNENIANRELTEELHNPIVRKF